MTGSLQVEETSAYCIINHWASASNYQLSNMEAAGLRFEPAASEVGGENSNRYTTEPPNYELDLFDYVMVTLTCKVHALKLTCY